MVATSDGERRRFTRITFHRPAQLDLGDGSSTCEVLDVSLRGALVEVSQSVRVAAGDACKLAIRLDAGEATIRMEGQISHREGTLAGVRCTAIDLESISHLRRLVELNLGDEEMLHRELANLVARPP